MNIKRIAIIGTGSMGGAILSGLLKSGFSPDNVSVSTKSTASAERLTDELGVLSFAMENGDDANQMAVAGANVVLIGVKPAYVTEVLADIADSLDDNALVISVAAGITTASMEAVLPEDVGVVRAMPNTPALIGMGVTGVAAGSRTTAPQLSMAERLFESYPDATRGLLQATLVAIALIDRIGRRRLLIIGSLGKRAATKRPKF